ncbi:hypothetical protein MC885_021834 [Smutsia gigantea]|nr:hypothetical protein MC885_021834 [Smutsia gigantea]
MTLQDSPREHFFLVTLEDLEEGDTDTYWCGVDRDRRVPQAPGAVTIFPGSVTVAVRPTEAPASPGALVFLPGLTLGDSVGPADGHDSCPGFGAHRPFLLFARFLFLALLKVILFLSFSYAAIWLAWLQHHL